MTTQKTQFIGPDQWGGYLEALKDSGGDDVYFQPEYVRLYAAPESVTAFVYENDRGLFFLPFIKTAVKRELSDAPLYDLETAYGYGGPLSTATDSVFLKEAWESFFVSCREAGLICGFVRFHPLLQNHRLAEGYVDTVGKSNEVVVLNLSKSEDEVWKNYEENARTKIRKAIKKGAEVVGRTDGEALEIFHKMYTTTMDQVGADDFYYFPPRYFADIAANFSGRFKVYLAYKDKAAIGGALVLLSQRFVHYHLSANIKEHREFEPASLLRHTVIMDHLNGNRESILFGGGGSAQANLFRFKAGFSKERADFFVGKFVFMKEVYETVCRAWLTGNPEKADQYQHYFLKYRF